MIFHYCDDYFAAMDAQGFVAIATNLLPNNRFDTIPGAPILGLHNHVIVPG